MAIPGEAYKALEDIVGEENITDEPATLDAYAYQFWAEFRQEGSKFMPRAGAVVLPKDTEEVQAIVRACNRYKLKCKASSTGWGLHAAPLVEDAIQLDMRRMDRIIEIDEKNMYAVIEPCVIGNTLQAEAMKVGLNTHMIGAGGSCSPLASATSFYGIGPDSLFMGTSPENLLGAEWVMPNGDILRTGSLGSGGGWFCGDGPGPSLRGVFRGAIGHAGGLGVFTKCAIKLYPWTGPAIMPIEGKPPLYTTPLPSIIRGHTITWSNWDGYRDALWKIFDNDIGYIAHRQFIMFGNELQGAALQIVTDPAKTIDDLEEIVSKPETQKLSEELYRSHKDKNFFPGLIEFMLTAPSVALVAEGKGVVQRVRELIGERVPEEADPGTIRREYASDGRRNIVHGSDSPGSARREIECLFSSQELYSYQDNRWLESEPG